MRILNAELADTFGNLLSRCCGKVLNPEAVVPVVQQDEFNTLSQMDVTKKMLELLNELPEKCMTHYRQYNFYLVVDSVIQVLHATNNFFESTAPWKLKKPEEKQQLQAILGVTMEVLRQAGIILQPIVPIMSGKLLDKLSVGRDRRLWTDLTLQLAEVERPLADTDAVLFRRIIPPKVEVVKEPKAKKVKKKN